MAFQKFTKPEKIEVVDGKVITDAIQKTGAKKVSDLTEEERQELMKELDNQD